MGRDQEVDRYCQGATWSRKARDRQHWRELAEGYFQQLAEGHILGIRYKVHQERGEWTLLLAEFFPPHHRVSRKTNII